MLDDLEPFQHLPQRLGVTEEQVSARRERIAQAPNEFLRRIGTEINRDVLAEDHVLGAGRRHRGLREIAELELDPIPDLFVQDEIPATLVKNRSSSLPSTLRTARAEYSPRRAFSRAVEFKSVPTISNIESGCAR